MSNKREQESASLGAKPLLAEDKSNVAEVDDWVLVSNRIDKSTRIIKNETKMALNDFCNRVMSNLVINEQLTDLSGVTDKNVKDKIAQIGDEQLKEAVESVYQRL